MVNHSPQRQPPWVQQSQRWYSTYLLKYISRSQRKSNESVFIFSAPKARRHISVPEERGDVWKKEVRELVTLICVTNSQWPVSSYAISFFIKLKLFGLWFPHVSNGDNLCFTWHQSFVNASQIPCGRWNIKRVQYIDGHWKYRCTK